MRPSILVSNFRDVGATVNALADAPLMREGVLFRGGELGLVNDLADIGGPRTVINLRIGKDPEFPGATILHLPAPNSTDVYLAGAGKNRKWIVAILKALAEETVPTPWYIHCAAGKDRTGVVTGAILAMIGIDPALIAEDYALSDGPLHPELFTQTLDAFAVPNYFRKLDRETVANRLLSS